jgi:peptidoglycan hydrolase-like amidase
MALRGKRFDEILAHYYTGAELLDTTRASVAPVSAPTPGQ